MDAGLRPVRSWGALGRGRGEFIYPVGVAWDGGSHVYVSEYGGNDRVQKFTLDGRFVLAFGAQGTGRGEFQRASGLAVMDGRVYVADAMNNRIQVFTDSGELVGALGEGRPGGPPSLHYPYDIEPADGGALFVMEYGAGRVTALSPAGEVLGRFGRTGRGPREMFTPWGLAVAADGAVLVADTGNRRIVELVR
jgi:DNA-binding beta-propeller fold protein YncE